MCIHITRMKGHPIHKQCKQQAVLLIVRAKFYARYVVVGAKKKTLEQHAYA